MIEGIVWIVVIVGIIVLFVKGRRPGRRSGIGTAAVGSMYDFLNKEKQNAIEIIVEEKAEARDPEDKDGNLPELENKRKG